MLQVLCQMFSLSLETNDFLIMNKFILLHGFVPNESFSFRETKIIFFLFNFPPSY